MPGSFGAAALPASPRLQVKYVDAGDLYVTWRWEHAPARPGAYAIPRALVQPVLDELERAVPTPLPGEPLGRALERAFSGPFGDPDRETRLTTRLAGALFPAPMAGELDEHLLRGARPHLRILPSASLARVPWEALLVDEGRRLVHEAEVSALSPVGVRSAPGRRTADYDAEGAVVAVLDPPLPGGMLGRVLPEGARSGSPVADLVSRLGGRLRGADPSVGGEVGRGALRRMLDGASRLLYVGHVSSARHGLDLRMHLSDGAESTGRAALIGPHRPLTAADIAYGCADEGPWPIPSRVALIACDSGGDARFAEPTALVSVLVRGGAEHVTAARWTLPTDAALAGIAEPGTAAFSSAVAAVDAAHEAADPVRALGAWQRDQADRWAAAGSPEHSPLLWAAFTTTWAPARGS